MEKWIRRFVWLIAGVVFSLAVAAMYISGSVNPDCFYDIGKVYDVPGKELERNAANVQFMTSADEYMTITEDSAAITFTIEEYGWKYLYAQLDHMSQSALTWNILCMDESNNIVAEYQYDVSEGWNKIELDGSDFSAISMRMYEQKGEQYLLQALSFRETPVIMDWQRALPAVFAAVAGYLLLSAVVNYIRRKWLQGRKYIITDAYLGLLEQIRKVFYPVFVNIPARQRKAGRTACFVGILLYMVYLFNSASWYVAYVQNTVVCSVLLFLIALLSIEKEIRQIRWNKNVIRSWLLFWGIVCISDFIVGKIYYAQGYVFILVFGFVFYVWAYMKNPGELVEDLLCAIQISFGVAVLFCIFCRPEITGARYMGIYTNANAFAAYLIPVLVACITILAQKVQKGIQWWKCSLYTIEIIWIVFFIWKTQSRGALVVALGIFLFVSWRIFRKRKELQIRQSIVRFVLCFLVLTIPAAAGMEWGLRTLPQRLGTQVILENDKVEEVEIAEGFGATVYASDSRIEKSFSGKSLDTMLSGRVTYWKTYFREMNLWGHKYKALVNGERHDPHNMWIGIMYRYGVVGGIAFLYMWLMMLYAWFRNRHKRTFGMFGLLMGGSYLVLGTLDALEQPWLYIAWLLVYFLMGMCFVDKISEYNIELS